MRKEGRIKVITRERKRGEGIRREKKRKKRDENEMKL